MIVTMVTMPIDKNGPAYETVSAGDGRSFRFIDQVGPVDEAVFVEECTYLSFDLPSDLDLGDYESLPPRQESLFAFQLDNFARYLVASTKKDSRATGTETVPAFIGWFNDPNEPENWIKIQALAEKLLEPEAPQEAFAAFGIFAETQSGDVGSLLYWAPSSFARLESQWPLLELSLIHI